MPPVIRLFPRHEQLWLCATCYKQQLFPQVSQDFPPHCHGVNESLSTRGAARLWLGARVLVHARIIMQHIQVWKKKKQQKKHVGLFKPTIQYFPDGTGPHGLAESEFLLFHMLSYKVTRWSKCSCRVVCLLFLIRVTKRLLKPKESAHHLQPPQLGTVSPVNLAMTALRCHSYHVFA